MHLYPTPTEAVSRAADGYYREKLLTGTTRAVLGTYSGTRRRLERV